MVQDPMRQQISPQDLAATVAAVLLVLGVLALAVLSKPIPAELSTSLGAAVGWLFVRSAQRAEHTQARWQAQNGTPPYPPEAFRDDYA
jgi:lauroyl/myristoyl acyltransferase